VHPAQRNPIFMLEMLCKAVTKARPMSREGLQTRGCELSSTEPGGQSLLHSHSPKSL